MVRDNRGVEQAVLHGGEGRGNSDTISSRLLNISAAPAFVPMSYICISKSRLQDLFIAGLNFAKSRSGGTPCSHSFGLYLTFEILRFQIEPEQVPSLTSSHTRWKYTEAVGKKITF